MTAQDEPFGLPLSTDDPSRIWGDGREAFKQLEERQTEIRRWAARYGSQALKEAIESGYDATGHYTRERAFVEYPGYTPVADTAVTFEERVNPSERALAELKRLRATVAELEDDYKSGLGFVKKVSGQDPAFAHLRGEAVAVFDYLDHYLLLKPTDSSGPVRRFTRRLLALLEAGTVLPQAFRILIAEESDVKLRHILSKAADDLEPEGPLAVAHHLLHHGEGVFSPFYLEMMRQAEVAVAGDPGKSWYVETKERRLDPLRRLVEDLEDGHADRR